MCECETLSSCENCFSRRTKNAVTVTTCWYHTDADITWSRA